MSCEKHPLQVAGYPGTLQELAKEVGNLRYDKIVEFMRALRNDLHEQAVNDISAGRTKLGATLERHGKYQNPT
jgi:hypothetical protein